MRRNSWKSVVAVLAMAMIVAPAFAKPASRVITMAADQKIAGKQLNHDYTFIVNDTKLAVELRHKVVAEVIGRWEPRDRTCEGNTVVSGADGQLLEVRFSGEKRAFVIGAM